MCVTSRTCTGTRQPALLWGTPEASEIFLAWRRYLCPVCVTLRTCTGVEASALVWHPLAIQWMQSGRGQHTDALCVTQSRPRDCQSGMLSSCHECHFHVRCPLDLCVCKPPLSVFDRRSPECNFLLSNVEGGYKGRNRSRRLQLKHELKKVPRQQ